MAVNEAGVIVGRVADQPVRWTSPAAAPEPLPLPPGATGGTAVAVTDDGTIVGRIDSRTNAWRAAYLWRADGRHGPLSLPMVDGEQALSFEPESIRDGWIYGTMWVSGEVIMPGSSAPSGGPDRPPLRSVRHLPFRYEIATGRSQQLSPPADRSRAAFHVGDQVVSLPPDPTQSESASYRAVSVGDDGRTAAGESDTVSAGPVRPVSWRCD